MTLKEQLIKLEKERSNDLQKGLLKEIQIAFDRYLRTYQTSKQKNAKDSSQAKEINDFRTKWA